MVTDDRDHDDAPRGFGIAVMAKASAPGRTKTRLAPPLTHAEAAEFNTAFLQDAADTLLRAGREAAISGYMAYGPPREGCFFERTMPPGIEIFECWQPGFGACLEQAARTLFAMGHAAAGLLNSDSPSLPGEILVEAASVLARPGDRAVLGPSSDGGYYLLGIKRLHARLFEDIAWSTEVVAEQTLARAREIGLPVHLLPAWFDVDDASSLRRLLAELADDGGAAGGERVPLATHTRELLARLTSEADLLRRLGLDLSADAEVVWAKHAAAARREELRP